MQRGNYELKKERMRAYSKTPAGISAIAKARAKTKANRGIGTRTKKINAKPLLNALANWGTS